MEEEKTVGLLSGKFSIDGLALDQEAKALSIERYQAAIDLLEQQLSALSAECNCQFEIIIRGGLLDLANLRLGVYDTQYTSYSMASDKKLAESTFREKTHLLPSDIDCLVDTDQSNFSRSTFSDFYKKFETIAQQIFWQTGVLVEISWR